MIVLSEPFIMYNFKNTYLNTYRYITIHNNEFKSSKRLFNVKSVHFKYVSPIMEDSNIAYNFSLLGSFLVIKVLSGQFPYIAKSKISSTFDSKTSQFIVSAHLNKNSVYKFISWFFIQFYNPITFYKTRFISRTTSHFALEVNSYNLIKQLSMHPIFFKWAETISISVEHSPILNVAPFLKLFSKN